MYKQKHSSSGHNRYTNNSSSSNDKQSTGGSSRFSLTTSLLDDTQYKTDHSQVYADDSKFARQLKKLLRDEEEDRKIQKILDLSSYLDQQENVKFVLKLAKQSLNVLLKVLTEQSNIEARVYLAECVGKVGCIMLGSNEPSRYFDWTIEKIGIVGCEQMRDNDVKVQLLVALQTNFKSDSCFRYLKENISQVLNELKKGNI